jgi:hypothetical protein
MATTGEHLRQLETSRHRTTRILVIVVALSVGLLIGGVVGRLTASSGPGAAGSTTVLDSTLTPAEQDQLAHQIQVVTSHWMQKWERACSSNQPPSVNVC